MKLNFENRTRSHTHAHTVTHTHTHAHTHSHTLLYIHIKYNNTGTKSLEYFIYSFLLLLMPKKRVKGQPRTQHTAHSTYTIYYIWVNCRMTDEIEYIQRSEEEGKNPDCESGYNLNLVIVWNSIKRKIFASKRFPRKGILCWFYAPWTHRNFKKMYANSLLLPRILLIG